MPRRLGNACHNLSLESRGDLLNKIPCAALKFRTKMRSSQDYAGYSIGILQYPAFECEIQVGPDRSKELSAMLLGKTLKRCGPNASVEFRNSAQELLPLWEGKK